MLVFIWVVGDKLGSPLAGLFIIKVTLDPMDVLTAFS
jgi:hypothetical protein